MHKSEIDLDEKYPNGYFDHYIAMFQSTVNEEGFMEHANTYIQIEGIEEFKILVEEIELIKKNSDWESFVALAKDYDKEELNVDCIKKLAYVAQKVGKEVV